MLISGEKCRGKAVCLEMTFPAACPDFELNILGVQIRVSPEGNSFSACGQEAPLDHGSGEEKKLCVLADTLSAECYACGGLVYANYMILAEREKGVSIKTLPGTEIKISTKLMSL